jgi:hypothetical protein
MNDHDDVREGVIMYHRREIEGGGGGDWGMKNPEI